MTSLVTKIRRELEALEIRPNKTLGQNFLINEGVYKKIVSAAEVAAGDKVVEIGAGLGTLTEYLAETGAQVLAIEKDRRLAAWLGDKFRDQKNVKIVEGDVLKIDPKTIELKSHNYLLVGNIPYYITSHFLRNVFEKWPRPKTVVLMIQKEVAKRITAKPPQMSILAVSVQYYAKAQIVSLVSRGSFYPAPKVDSAIIKLSDINTEGQRGFEKKFFKVVTAGFRGKRKQLTNTLATNLKLPKQEVERRLTSIGVDPKRRPETLTLEEWKKITNTLL